MKRKTPAQVKNLMHRAFADLLDPPPTQREERELREHFEHRCAYCRASAGPRDGHIDHAEADAGNSVANLILACRICNGDEKREMHWEEFLARKCSGDRSILADRRARITAWMAKHTTRPVRRPPANLQALRDSAEAEAKASFDAAYRRVREAATQWRSEEVVHETRGDKRHDGQKTE